MFHCILSNVIKPVIFVENKERVENYLLQMVIDNISFFSSRVKISKVTENKILLAFEHIFKKQPVAGIKKSLEDVLDYIISEWEVEKNINSPKINSVELNKFALFERLFYSGKELIPLLINHHRHSNKINDLISITESLHSVSESLNSTLHVYYTLLFFIYMRIA